MISVVAKFESHWQWGYEHIRLFKLILGSAADTSLGQVIYCSLPQFPHLHNGIITVPIIAHNTGLKVK